MPVVRDILSRKGGSVFTIGKEATVLAAAREMNEHRIGALCIVEGDCVIGIFTERDVLNRVVAKQLDPAKTLVADVMTSPVITCKAETKAADCAIAMSSKKIRHLPVVEGDDSCGKLVGMVSTGDLMALDVSVKQAHIEHLHNYLHGRS